MTSAPTTSCGSWPSTTPRRRVRSWAANGCPTFAVAILVVAAGDYVGLCPASLRLAEQHATALGLRWFPAAVDPPEMDVRLLWRARLDADSAQWWLRDTLRAAVGA